MRRARTAQGSVTDTAARGTSFIGIALPTGGATAREFATPIETANFDGARRLSDIQRTDAVRPRLSDRQRDCIYRAAGGKSEGETAQILGIGHGTAPTHERGAEALLFLQRDQLAIHALYDGALTFTDAMRR
ncbi:hypothetical protein ACCC88_00330 [Sphingomonas sp. Sphisp140]|uniref:hypothetical protein n=1 Tax=unclassified Sphingomonas TaxID=196159 RepID=UPI0039B00BBE